MLFPDRVPDPLFLDLDRVEQQLLLLPVLDTHTIMHCSMQMDDILAPARRKPRRRQVGEEFSVSEQLRGVRMVSCDLIVYNAPVFEMYTTLDGQQRYSWNKPFEDEEGNNKEANEEFHHSGKFDVITLIAGELQFEKPVSIDVSSFHASLRVDGCRGVEQSVCPVVTEAFENGKGFAFRMEHPMMILVTPFYRHDLRIYVENLTEADVLFNRLSLKLTFHQIQLTTDSREILADNPVVVKCNNKHLLFWQGMTQEVSESVLTPQEASALKALDAQFIPPALLAAQ